jgi:hypothetical protein
MGANFALGSEAHKEDAYLSPVDVRNGTFLRNLFMWADPNWLRVAPHRCSVSFAQDQVAPLRSFPENKGDAKS